MNYVVAANTVPFNKETIEPTGDIGFIVHSWGNDYKNASDDYFSLLTTGFAQIFGSALGDQHMFCDNAFRAYISRRRVIRFLSGTIWRIPMADEDYHTCHFCGEYVKDGHNPKGERHWLSDCRPDLVEHEPGKLCTWFGMPDGNGHTCYAYQDSFTREWGDEHKHFYKDGPM